MPPKTRAAARKTRRKDRKNVTHGHAYIKSTFNNTIVSLTDPHGAVIAQVSSRRLLKWRLCKRQTCSRKLESQLWTVHFFR